MSPDPLLSLGYPGGVWHETNLIDTNIILSLQNREKCSMVSASKEYSIISAYPQSQAEASSTKAQGLTLKTLGETIMNQ